jgi:hypothetical protein
MPLSAALVINNGPSFNYRHLTGKKRFFGDWTRRKEKKDKIDWHE